VPIKLIQERGENGGRKREGERETETDRERGTDRQRRVNQGESLTCANRETDGWGWGGSVRVRGCLG